MTQNKWKIISKWSNKRKKMKMNKLINRSKRILKWSMNQKTNNKIKKIKKKTRLKIKVNNLPGNMNRLNFIANLQHFHKFCIVWKLAQLKDRWLTQNWIKLLLRAWAMKLLKIVKNKCLRYSVFLQHLIQFQRWKNLQSQFTGIFHYNQNFQKVQKCLKQVPNNIMHW